MALLRRASAQPLIYARTASVTSLHSHLGFSNRHFSRSQRNQDATDTLSQLGLSFVDGVEASVVAVQAATGCPWWLTVVGLTVSVRAVATLPVTLYQQHKLAQLELLGPRLKAWGTAIAHRVMAMGKDKGLTDQDAQSLINAQVRLRLAAQQYPSFHRVANECSWKPRGRSSSSKPAANAGSCFCLPSSSFRSGSQSHWVWSTAGLLAAPVQLNHACLQP